jgi:hypothetical protein
MSTAMHPAAPHHLPAFIAAPGETDYLLVGSAVFLLLMVLVLGTVYFRLHALPEHLAHRNASKLQFEVVAVLALLALFTHNNTLWIAALLLALVPIPDLYGPLARMADALAKMAGSRRAAAETSGPVHDPPGEVPERSRRQRAYLTAARLKQQSLQHRTSPACLRPYMGRWLEWPTQWQRWSAGVERLPKPAVHCTTRRG